MALEEGQREAHGFDPASEVLAGNEGVDAPRQVARQRRDPPVAADETGQRRHDVPQIAQQHCARDEALGRVHSTTTKRPPGVRTRTISIKAASEPKCRSAKPTTTRSKAPDPKGNRSARPSTQLTRGVPVRASFLRAAASMAWQESKPTATPVGPATRAAGMMSAPVPLATSRIACPGHNAHDSRHARRQRSSRPSENT